MEVEIKLHVLPGVDGGPAAFFERLATIGSLAGTPLGRPARLVVRDLYYDTADGALAQAKAGLRLRVENGSALVTLKESRRRDGALTEREEIEHPLSAQHLAQVLTRIRPLVGPEPVSLDDFAAGRRAGPLVPVLEVVTHRVARQMGAVGTLTLDWVEYPGVGPEPYFDIEVEAAEGQVDESVLRRAEAELGRLAGGHLLPATMSKLERGLRLAAIR